MTQYEQEARAKGLKRIAGVDEAGRGPLAGPVVAAACFIPEGVFLPGVDDSKKLPAVKRKEVFAAIKKNRRIRYGIGVISVETIDAINIYQATVQAMLQAIEKLACILDILFIDGMNLMHPHIPCQRIVGGDAKSQSIAAASIIAKETRDQLMVEYHETWPQYGFNRHKGYGTEYHLEALAEHGPCPIHRRSFSPVKEASEITAKK